MNQRPALGKGLASLLGQNNPPPQAPSVSKAESIGSLESKSGGPTVSNKDRHPGIAMAFADEIIANEYQPRHDFDERALQELSDSIKENGIIQPLIVRKTDSGYRLIAGERRLRAAKLAGLKMVPVVVRKSTDKEALELALVENIQRQDLNCVDEALAYQQLMDDFHLTQEEVAKKVGKERATVGNFLRLLKLSSPVLEALKTGKITMGHAKALLSIEKGLEREALFDAILTFKLSVREAEKRAQNIQAKANEATESPSTQESDVKKEKLRVRIENLSNDRLVEYLQRGTNS
jgi:ParB family chromosome partitioning protein